MCGITGYITTRPTKKVITAFKSLLIANEDRGNESTGIYFNKTIHKTTLKATNFVDKLNDNELLKSYLTIGHTRLATTGNISKDNAHPFNFGNITGIHNGVISNYQDIFKKANVDSQAIFYLLNKNNNDFKKTFKKLEGSMAVAWTNNDNKLYLMRHNNPLSIAYINDTLFFSSELYHLNSILYALYGNITKLITEIPENEVYIIDRNLKTKQVKIKVKQEPSYIQSYQDYYSNKNNTIDDIDDKSDIYKGQSSKAIFQDLADTEGCAICLNYLDEGYLDKDTYQIYCQDCMITAFDKNQDLEYIKLKASDYNDYFEY